MKNAIVLFLMLIWVSVSTATTIHIPSDFKSIQQGISAAQTGDTILVSPGTYSENLYINKQVVVGSHYLLTKNPHFIYNTIINGKKNRVVIFDNHQGPSQLSGFILINGYASRDGGGIHCDNSHPLLEDLIILQCRAERSGGGIALSKSNPILKNVKIYDNHSISSGGGIYVDRSMPKLKDVIISQNKSGKNHSSSGGGGITISGSKPSFSNVTIKRNHSDGKGGGLRFTGSACYFNTTNRCNIYLNSAPLGNDISAERGLRVVVDTFTVREPDETFVHNLNYVSFDILNGYDNNLPDSLDIYVAVDGNNMNSGRSCSEPMKNIEFAKIKLIDNTKKYGTIHLAPGVYGPKTNGEVFELNWNSYINLVGSGVESTILDAANTTEVFRFSNVDSVTFKDLRIINGKGYLAGAMRIEKSNIRLVNVIIEKCDGMYGGTIYVKDSSLELVNILLVNNLTHIKGGGLYVDNSNVNILNSTIANNNGARNIGQVYGGAFYATNSRIDIFNSILWNNAPQEVAFGETSKSDTLVAAYSNIKGGKSKLAVNDSVKVMWHRTNLNFDPLFVNADMGDFRLADESYCLGTGIKYFSTENQTFRAPRFDILNNPRPNPQNYIPDIGAYESPIKVRKSGLMLADFDVDITKGAVPLTVRFENYSRAGGLILYHKWDFDSDGVIDSKERNPVWTFEESGLYTVSLTVADLNISDSILKNDFISVRDKSDIYISPTGNDSTGMGSQEKPFKSIQKGIDIALDMDRILLFPGTYHENIIIRDINVELGSLFLTTGDSSYIEKTIIDADENGTVINIQHRDSTIINGITITNGSAEKGGGIYCNQANPVIKNSIIINSRAKYGGGLAFDSSKPKIENVILESNFASREGGAVYCENRSTLRLTNVNFESNVAVNHGGGISCQNSSVFINDTRFTKNEATIMNGGGLYCNNTSANLTKVEFFNNSAGLGGAVMGENKSGFDFNNVTIAQNSAGKGGAIYCSDYSHTRIKSSTIACNSATHGGGGIACKNKSIPYVVNSILWYNKPDEIFVDKGDLLGPKQYGTVALAYCNIEGFLDKIDLNVDGLLMLYPGNINVVPLFEDKEGLEFRLQAESPCIDAGITQFFRDDFPRIDIDDNDYLGSAPDMGAFEFDPATGVESTETLPTDFKLDQNYPNPFNAQTTISYYIPKPSHIRLAVYNTNGQLVDVLADEQKSAGSYTTTWDGSRFSSGLYFYKISSAHGTVVKKLLLVR
jgi:predicted outer membrane repeat protein